MEKLEGSSSTVLQMEIQHQGRELRLRSLKIKRWLRTDEVALYLGTSQGAVRNLLMRGQLRAKKCFGRNFFDREEIDKRIETSNGTQAQRPAAQTIRRTQWR